MREMRKKADEPFFSHVGCEGTVRETKKEKEKKDAAQFPFFFFFFEKNTTLNR